MGAHLDIVEFLKFFRDSIKAFASADARNRAKVASHFLNLATTFEAFLPAHKAKDISEMERLASETRGLLDSLGKDKIFIKVVGEDAKVLLKRIEAVANAKELLASKSNSRLIKNIRSAAGYFRGYHKTLSTSANNAT